VPKSGKPFAQLAKSPLWRVDKKHRLKAQKAGCLLDMVNDVGRNT